MNGARRIRSCNGEVMSSCRVVNIGLPERGAAVNLIP